MTKSEDSATSGKVSIGYLGIIQTEQSFVSSPLTAIRDESSLGSLVVEEAENYYQSSQPTASNYPPSEHQSNKDVDSINNPPIKVEYFQTAPRRSLRNQSSELKQQ